MWKNSQHPTPSPVPVSTPVARPAETAPETPQISRAPILKNTLDQATVSRGLFFKGEITGEGAIFIDGKIEGSINLPGERVSVGINGHVSATMTSTSGVCISAREIIVMGYVKGNITASERVDIRAEGTLVGDVSTTRISIADGAIFRGGVELKKTDNQQDRDATKLSAKNPTLAANDLQPA
jgi:cytoskeletal protein CcmA (bactofilin family)